MPVRVADAMSPRTFRDEIPLTGHDCVDQGHRGHALGSHPMRTMLCKPWAEFALP